MNKIFQIGLAVLQIFSLILLVALGVYTFYFNQTNLKKTKSLEDEIASLKKQISTTNVTPTQDPTISPTATGAITPTLNNGVNYKYLKVPTLPTGWKVVEYENGAGSKMLSDAQGTYKGLTALAVVDQNGITLLKLEGVWGIGGTGECSEYYKFKDNDANYYNEIVDTNNEMSQTKPSIVDFTNTKYSDVTLFETKFRRVKNILYHDIKPGDQYFQAGCGLSRDYVELSKLNFILDNQKINDYKIGIPSSLTDAEGMQLDKVMSGLSLK